MARAWLVLGALALVYLQARLWLMPGNWREVWVLQEELLAVDQHNEHLAARNADAEAWVRLLDGDPASLEFQARHDLGLVRPGETLYVIPQ
nr:septum formation initiator family protein [Oceanococcus sp. HetDA_MAG_MS8]